MRTLERRAFRSGHKIFADSYVLAYLKELQAKYVLVPTDKDGNSIKNELFHYFTSVSSLFASITTYTYSIN